MVHFRGSAIEGPGVVESSLAGVAAAPFSADERDPETHLEPRSAPGGSSGGTLVRGQKRPKTKIFNLFLRFGASGQAQWGRQAQL